MPNASGVPSGSGYRGLQLRKLLEDDQFSNLVKQAQVKKYLASTDSDSLTNQKIQAQIANIKARTADVGSSDAPVTTPTGRHTVQTPLGYMTPEAAGRYYGSANGRSPRAAADPGKEFDSWLHTNMGIGLSDWRNLQNSHLGNYKVDAKGHALTDQPIEGNPNGSIFEATTAAGKRFHAPAPVYNQALQMYQQKLGAPSVSTSPAAATSAAASPSSVPTNAGQQAAGIKAQFRAGTLTADEATAKLQALGFD